MSNVFSRDCSFRGFCIVDALDFIKGLSSQEVAILQEDALNALSFFGIPDSP